MRLIGKTAPGSEDMNTAVVEPGNAALAIQADVTNAEVVERTVAEQVGGRSLFEELVLSLGREIHHSEKEKNCLPLLAIDHKAAYDKCGAREAALVVGH